LRNLFKKHQIDGQESDFARYKSTCSIIVSVTIGSLDYHALAVFSSLGANGSILKKHRGCGSECELFCLMCFRTL
jgi:hypothetical protein